VGSAHYQKDNPSVRPTLALAGFLDVALR
jgi:hypothetical protein